MGCPSLAVPAVQICTGDWVDDKRAWKSVLLVHCQELCAFLRAERVTAAVTEQINGIMYIPMSMDKPEGRVGPINK